MSVRPRRGLALAAALLVVAAALLALLLRAPAPRDAPPPGTGAGPPSAAPDPALVERGAYLARAGNCAGCHTARGGAPMAGGRGIETPFGTVYAGNLTPDAATGIGGWSAADFRRALHEGRSKDGRLLYPAFPYPNYTRVTPADADAIHAWLRSLPPVRQPNRAHELRFPYGSQASLAVWRALFFRPGTHRDDPARSAEWNRGSYLVRGLGHCNACHAARNFLGATSERLELSGGLMPMRDWYAPSLASSREAGVAGWTIEETVALLKTGATARAVASGPMAEVVFRSTQHLADADLRAMAVFLRALPQARTVVLERRRDPSDAAARELLGRGGRLYARHCAACHGDGGEGAAGAYPPLAGNRAVTMDIPANIVRIVLHGGFPPATAGNPRPYGMPPFVHALDDADVSAVASYIRAAWGNDAPAVTVQDVRRWR